MPLHVPERRLAATALFGAGLAAGLGQVVLVRELLNIAAGNELTIGIMLAGWFLWGAVGAGIVGRVAAKDESVERSRVRVLYLPLFSFWAIIQGIGFARAVPFLLSKLPTGLGAQLGEVMGLPQLVAVALLTVMAAGGLAGAQFAAGLKLYTQLDDAPRAVGFGYAYDALGHLTGGVLAAVFLVWGLSAPTMALVGGLASLWTGATLWDRQDVVRLHPRPMNQAGLFGLIFMSALSVAYMWMPLPHPLAARSHVLAERESPYGSWAVTKFGQSGAYFHLDGAPVGCSPATPGMQFLVHFPMLQVPFARSSVSSALTPSPSPTGRGEPEAPRVLLIGGGANGALAQVLQYPVNVDYTELDPALISLAKQYSVGEDRAALLNGRVLIHEMDGRRWVRVATARRLQYDAVILAVPDPSTAQVNRFYTADFFRQVATLLKPAGVLGLEMPSSDTYFGDELLRLDAVLLRTVQSVFPQVALLPGDPMVVAASQSADLTEDPEVLRARYDKLRLAAVEFRAQVSDRLFAFTLRQVWRDLEQAPPTPLNTDERPVGYFYGQAFWVAQHSRGSWAVFQFLARLQPWPLAAAILTALALLLGPAAAWRKGRGLAVPLAIFGTGALAMTLELVLLFAFQVSYGYVYQLLGMLTGAFMVGLAAGGIGGAGLAARSDAPQSRRLLGLAQALVALVAFLLPLALRLVGSMTALPAADILLPYVAFPLLMAVVGLVVGAEFPLAARSMSEGRAAARAGAAIYAADLAGAALGALVAGAALVPVLGMTDTCLLAALLSAGLAGLLLLRE